MIDENGTRARGGGVGLGTVLFIVFLILKLCGAINCSWWWVTVPLWGPLVFVMVVCILAGVFVALRGGK